MEAPADAAMSLQAAQCSPSFLSTTNPPWTSLTVRQEDCLQLTRSATRDDGELRDRSALVPGVSNNTKLVLPGPLSPRLHTVRAKPTFVPPLIPPGQRSILRPPEPGRTRGCSGGLGTAGS